MDDLSTGQSGKILAKSLNVRIHYVGGGAKLPSLTLSWTERQLSQISPRSGPIALGLRAESSCNVSLSADQGR